MEQTHTELAEFLPPQMEPASRKMLSCTLDTHDKVSKIAREMKVSRSKVLIALVDFYLGPE